MNEASTSEAVPGESLDFSPRAGVWRYTCGFENGALAVVLALMVLLPLIEILLRQLNSGIDAAATFEQHLTLFVGMLGGALAAREGRLLALSAVDMLFRTILRAIFRIFTSAVGLTVVFFLTAAAAKFVEIEASYGDPIAYGIPKWVLQAVMPIGFGLIAVRIWWNSANRKARSAYRIGARVATLLLFFVFASLFLFWPIEDRSILLYIGLPVLIAATILGLPIFAALGGAAMILFWANDLPLPPLPADEPLPFWEWVREAYWPEYLPVTSVALDHYRQVTNPTLPTLPLFTLAGFFLAEGGASRRLIRLCQSMVGFVRGGPALVTVLVCAFFTSFTGASGVTILALAVLLMPVLLEAGYEERPALGLLTGAGSLGMLFPPCLPVILYAIIAEQPIEAMFLGGMLPGVLLVGLTGAWGVWKSPKDDVYRQPFAWKELKGALQEASWEVLIPVVALVGIFSGWATPVEAAAVTAFYAFIVETFIYKDLRLFRDVPKVMAKCGLLVGGLMLILGVALGFTGYLIDAKVPTHAVEWIQGTITERWIFLLCLNLLLIVVGCLMDVFSAIIVMVPLIVPMGQAFGIDPIHLGVIFLANLELGYITPPIGMNLFLSSYRFNKPVPEVCRAIVPILLVQIVGVLLITYVPPLSTWLPGWLISGS